MVLGKLPAVPWRPQTATIVVAASDSLYDERADYVCDGVADNVEIQAAIDALPAGGGSIVLLDGTYNITTTITSSNYCYIKGQGFGTILDVSALPVNRPSIIMGDYSTISSLKINGSIDPLHNIYHQNLSAGNHTTIEGIWMNAVATGIAVQSKQDVKIINCILTNVQAISAWGPAVYTHTSSQVSIQGIFVSDSDRGLENRG